MSQDKAEKVFKPVSSSKVSDFIKDEQAVLKFWEKHHIFDKVLKLNTGGSPFVFFEGPPTANGLPHVGHVLTRIMKDVVVRYKTMCGYDVPRKAGWDTHGLPVEIEVEKELNLSGKKDIEGYGIEKFVQQCKQSVFKYKAEWEKLTRALAYWVDLNDPYITLDNKYIESLWWALKELWSKGLLYKKHRVVPFCPRCSTTLSSHEVAQGYKDVADPSIFVKFKLKPEFSIKFGSEDVFLLVWTTTPWTLFSNVALAINADQEYVLVQNQEQLLILAKARLEVLEGENRIIRDFKGEFLLNLCYEPLFPYLVLQPDKKAFLVVQSEAVSMSEGSGIVHLAPPFGELDYALGQEYNLDFFQPVNEHGKFTGAVPPFIGKFVKGADAGIIKQLEADNKLYKTQSVVHAYPFCWRCDSPLLYYAREAWFIKVTALKEQLIANNRKINWIPEEIKEGRFGQFLENLIDWNVSRERYWGTPLNAWVCANAKCNHIVFVGSIKELCQLGNNVSPEIELHRPYVDAVIIKCPKCSADMKREPYVIDCWFDSGCMHTAQWHYPFENQESFKRNFPADFICEAIDQTRGWFYSLIATATLLYGREAFSNVVVLGHVLGKDGLKMSKSKGNVVNPGEIMQELGVDAIRWYFYTATHPWVPRLFYKEIVLKTLQKFMGTLKNVYSFFVLYANIDGFVPAQHAIKAHALLPVDGWVLSRLNSLAGEVKTCLDAYDIYKAARLIEDFVVEDLSTWYVRLNRARFWGKRLDENKLSAFVTLYEVLFKLSRLIAPFAPFLAEEMYQNLAGADIKDKKMPESVHLCDYPLSESGYVNKNLEAEMDTVRNIVFLGRTARETADIKVRQPLAEIIVCGIKAEMQSRLAPLEYLILDELNIKKLGFNAAIETLPADRYAIEKNNQLSVAVDKKLTPELESEGLSRELVSKIQHLRKQSGFKVTDHILLAISSQPEVVAAFNTYQEYICRETLAVAVETLEENSANVRQKVKINGRETEIFLCKAG